MSETVTSAPLLSVCLPQSSQVSSRQTLLSMWCCHYGHINHTSSTHVWYECPAIYHLSSVFPHTLSLTPSSDNLLPFFFPHTPANKPPWQPRPDPHSMVPFPFSSLSRFSPQFNRQTDEQPKSHCGIMMVILLLTSLRSNLVLCSYSHCCLTILTYTTQRLVFSTFSQSLSMTTTSILHPTSPERDQQSLNGCLPASVLLFISTFARKLMVFKCQHWLAMK